MAKIRVDTDALRHNSADINRRIQELEGLNARLDALLNDIEGSWQGAASVQYINTMRSHKKKAEQMIQVLSEFRKYINEATRRFEQKDRDSASRIRNC